jgi:hypothetical protein
MSNLETVLWMLLIAFLAAALQVSLLTSHPLIGLVFLGSLAALAIKFGNA